MERKEFEDIWEFVAKPEIAKTISMFPYRIEAKEYDKNFKENVYSRYQCEREIFSFPWKVIL